MTAVCPDRAGSASHGRLGATRFGGAPRHDAVKTYRTDAPLAGVVIA
ncbi:MAG TPA: hypothetical protein VLJ20_09680 [Acetobacteraceae bacterium]|nr:hypothetical protein [Acetobacteraceae bacterium]